MSRAEENALGAEPSDSSEPFFWRDFEQELKEDMACEETEDGNWWSWSSLTSKECPERTESTCQFVKWALGQVILGHYRVDDDENRNETTLVIGRKAAHYSSEEEARTTSKTRLAMVKYNLTAIRTKMVGDAGGSVVAKGLAERLGDPEKRAEVELALAREIVGILGAFSKRLLDFDAPDNLPVPLPGAIAAQMEEAAKCYLTGYYLGAISISRTCLESALDERLKTLGLKEEFEAYQKARKREFDKEKRRGNNPKSEGKLQQMIDFVARQLSLGKVDFLDVAHDVRQDSNDVIHGKKEATKEFAKVILTRLHKVVSDLFSHI